MRELDMYQGYLQEFTWQQTPFLMADGIEVLENVRRVDGEDEELLEPYYIHYRDQLLEDGIIIHAAKGNNKVGKGGVLMGLARTYRQDEHLREELATQGRKLVVLADPFALSMQAAMLPQAPSRFRIPRGLTTHTVKWEHTRRVSKLQWLLARQRIIPEGSRSANDVVATLREQGKAVVGLVECSVSLAYPTDSRVPAQVEGKFDLVSAYYNLAFDPTTRPFSHFMDIEADKDLEEDKPSLEFREEINSEDPSLSKLLSGETQVKISLKNGEEVYLHQLSPEDQRRVLVILRRSMATPAGIRMHNEALAQILQDLASQAVISEPSLSDYNQFIRDRLPIADNRYSRIINKRFGGGKTYDLEYLIDNAVTREFPQLFDLPDLSR